MDWLDVIWTEENRQHVEEHGLTTDEVEYVLRNPGVNKVSRSSGRPIAIGRIHDGRLIAVVYEEIDEMTVYPVTAYEV